MSWCSLWPLGTGCGTGFYYYHYFENRKKRLRGEDGWRAGWVQQRPLAQATGKSSPCGFLVVKAQEVWRGYPKGLELELELIPTHIPQKPVLRIEEGTSRGSPIVSSSSPQVRNGPQPTGSKPGKPRVFSDLASRKILQVRHSYVSGSIFSLRFSCSGPFVLWP